MRHASNQVSCRLLMSQRGTGLEADHGCVESLVLDQPSSLQSSVIVVVSWLEILNWPNWQFFFLCVISMEPVDCIRSMLPNKAGSSFSVDKNNTDTLSAQPTDAAPRDPGVWPRLLPNSEVHISVPSLQLNLRPMAYSMRLFSALWLGGRSAAL